MGVPSSQGLTSEQAAAWSTGLSLGLSHHPPYQVLLAAGDVLGVLEGEESTRLPWEWEGQTSFGEGGGKWWQNVRVLSRRLRNLQDPGLST